MSERDLNQEVAEQICRTSRWHDKDFQRGDCLALLDGKVIAVANDLMGALKSLRDADPDPERGMIVEVAPPVTDVIR